MPQVTEIGDNCPKCNTPVVLKDRPKNKSINPHRMYYYKKYLYCPKCETQYFQSKYIVYINVDIKRRQPKEGTQFNRVFRKRIMELFRECPNELKTEYGRKLIQSAKTLKWW